MTSAANQTLSPVAVQQHGGWQLLEFTEVTSTNTVAAPLAPWHAVRAATQTAGRGRFQRNWVSNAGGLWLSAVVPCGPTAETARELPLLAGLAVADALLALCVGPASGTTLRLRWPNDLLVGTRKLAGLLVDQFQPGRAVVGIGVNVSNNPSASDATLAGHAVALAELLAPAPAPALHELAGRILDALRATLETRAAAGMAALTPRINALWDGPRPVRLDLDGPLVTGDFLGVDSSGRLQLRLPTGDTQFFEPHQVRLLRELQT